MKHASLTAGTGTGKRSLFEDELEMEIDPSKLEEETEAAVNKYKLLLTTQKFFQQIIYSKDKIPPQIRAILAHLSKVVIAKFPNAKYKAIGGFYFLRLIVPAITTPHIWGLYTAPPNATTQRHLILLGKVLQNLCNDVQFGGKEEYMQKLNDFMEENTKTLHTFFNSLATAPAEPPIESVKVPEVVRTNALLFLYEFIYSHQSKIQQALNNNHTSEIIASLNEIIAELGAPPSKK
jgi:neurofibromin 1